MTRRVLLIFGAAHRDLAAIWASQLPLAAVLIERRSPATRLRTILRRVRRLGLLRTVGQLLFRVQRSLTNRFQHLPPPLFGWLDEGTAAPTIPANVPTLEVADVNSPAALDFVKRHPAAIAGVYGVSVIRQPLLDSLPNPAINLHTGLTQHNRGLHSSFWALSDGQPDQIGFTLHLLTSGLDTGDIVAQESLGASVAHESPTMAWINRKVELAGAKRMLAVLQAAAAGEPVVASPLLKKGRLRSDPTWREYRRVLKQWKLH